MSKTSIALALYSDRILPKAVDFSAFVPGCEFVQVKKCRRDQKYIAHSVRREKARLHQLPNEVEAKLLKRLHALVPTTQVVPRM